MSEEFQEVQVDATFLLAAPTDRNAFGIGRSVEADLRFDIVGTRADGLEYVDVRINNVREEGEIYSGEPPCAYGATTPDECATMELPVAAKRIDDLAAVAMSAFWGAVASNYPEATSGDFPPDAVERLEKTAWAAVAYWVELNTPPRRPTPHIGDENAFILCANSDHDHFVPLGTDQDEQSHIPGTRQMLCNHCLEPLFYDRRLEGYFHDEPAKECFLTPRWDK